MPRRSKRPAAVLAVVVALAGATIASRRSPLGAGSPDAGRRPDAGVAARIAHDRALAVPLSVTLLAAGAEVAQARLEGDRAEVSASGLTGVHAADRLHAGGATVSVPPLDRARLLAPLSGRPARWDGRHLHLDGDPPARAWLDERGALARLEVGVGGGGLLVVTPAG